MITPSSAGKAECLLGDLFLVDDGAAGTRGGPSLATATLRLVTVATPFALPLVISLAERMRHRLAVSVLSDQRRELLRTTRRLDGLGRLESVVCGMQLFASLQITLQILSMPASVPDERGVATIVGDVLVPGLALLLLVYQSWILAKHLYALVCPDLCCPAAQHSWSSPTLPP